ncbi:protein-tyrosine phosphatase family protein [Proteus mirabilis]|uniref:protein-tyrosine phosphatase family protein n=1 Tax=Proteus mirabilis TaxID=584 RepID=UPI00227EA6B5|nr:protein-tyrosine phosphatase family protein [Proteus mirabilis]MCY9776052.1 protein tyrosine phosphatase [Proteus mirabilis]MCY9782155.1 protein tyrosine phosphatase [Proteus mirabilis]MCY9789980.1 protein tyrosine phosphatase [Proteus mirabilis]
MLRIIPNTSTFNSIKNIFSKNDTKENAKFSSINNTSTKWYTNSSYEKKSFDPLVPEKLKKVNNISRLPFKEELERLYHPENSSQYNKNNYQYVPNSRYDGRIPYCKNTLITSDGVLLPANNVSADNSPYMTIASQYPLNNKESLKHYFNMLFDNDINTVYILASNDDIIRDRSILLGEYNKSNYEKDGFRYFRENLDLGNIKSSHIEKWVLNKKETYLDCKAYIKLVTKENNNEKKIINFVHIYNWPDHTAIDALKLRNTINTVGYNLNMKPTKENIAVHCLAGLGRTGEFIALMEMMKMIETGNTKTRSLESIICDLREKRSMQLLKKREQVDELIKFAINNNIPLVNDHIKIK